MREVQGNRRLQVFQFLAESARGTRRIVFSIVFSWQSLQAFAFFKLTKSRRTFYRKFQFRSFHTAKTNQRHHFQRRSVVTLPAERHR